MVDLTKDSDDIMASAGDALVRARTGGSIGSKSHALKRKHFWRKLAGMGIAVGAIWVIAGIIGAIINGIGFTGVMAVALLTVLAVGFFAFVPKLEVPTPAKLRKGDLKTLAGKTEMWLESQRPALPPPAQKLVDGIGVQLDELAPQLQTLDENSPAAVEVRKLVGEHLPELVEGYRRIPGSMRSEDRGTGTPEQNLVDGLKTIEREIAGATRSIAQGDADQLAIKGRFLQLKYDGVGSE